MITLETITVESHVIGIVPGKAVKIISVSFIGTDAVKVYYEDAEGNLGNQMLFRDAEPNLELLTAGRPWSFDGNGSDFRLAAEAYRIHLAHLFDPLMAVHTSNVEPLPHQITAVYESMLPRQPLRFLLADDPGAGKTIMSGLLLRELMLRGDVKRCLIVSPGSLVEQWQDEMEQKFGVTFQIFTRDMVEACATGNPFDDPRNNLLICRLDQLSRNGDLQQRLEHTDWDLIVIDEAHKLSAHYFGNEVKKTKRFQLGELLGRITRHLLLMTATPHNGKEEDFQLFLSLIDSDRFYGKFRDGVHVVDVSDVMRRMVKEELLKFDGTPLFPERCSYTVNYKLSDAEAALYEAVTQYVCEEMNRADKLKDGKRKGTVGFALTILQRRLASSPEAIYRSIERRRKNLERRLEEEKLRHRGQTILGGMGDIPGMTDEDIDDFLDEAPDAEIESLEEKVVDQATAAETIAELEIEIATLKNLEQQAHQVRVSGQDKKWEELSRLLQDTPEMRDESGQRRKMIIFTEHRDTLNYLDDRIKGLIGNPDAVVLIHGGTRREDRRSAQERFTQDKEVIILLATDAAGEGVNLQRANLMVNYDLPWNPNRLEQRFGRIHRIGQTEVCHLWNLVANETREGDVFQRLFEKLETERKALGGRVYDILGEIFSDTSLKALLIEAIRYGNSPEVKARLFEKVEGALDDGHLREVMQRTALATEHMGLERMFAVRDEMEKAEARKLQPHFIKAFFTEAMSRLGSQLFQRESGRFEIKHVPVAIRSRDRVIGNGVPVLKSYDRICFEKEKVRQQGKPLASLLCPGHPMMDALLDVTLEKYRSLLKQGTILIDPADEGTEPRVLFIIDHSIRDGGLDKHGQQRIVSRRMQFVHVDAAGTVTQGGYAPYLDYQPASEDEQNMVKDILDVAWLRKDLEDLALAHAAQTIVPEHFDEVKNRMERIISHSMQAVQDRLVKEINHWTHRALQLEQQVQAGQQPRMQPENAKRRAEELTERLQERIKDLEARRHVASNVPLVVGGALIIPQGLIDKRQGKSVPQWAADAAARAKVEQLAMQAVMACEQALGHQPEDVSAVKCGWDITSRTPAGDLRFIEVKGRVKGATTVTVTKNEILTGFNQPDKFILAIVLVDGDAADMPCYIKSPFKSEPEFGISSVNYDLAELLSLAKERIVDESYNGA
jgi:superfamily II DNA or RNA helicase